MKTILILLLIGIVLISGCKSELNSCMRSCMEKPEVEYTYEGVYSWGFDVYTEENLINKTLQREYIDNCYNECKPK